MKINHENANNYYSVCLNLVFLFQFYRLIIFRYNLVDFDSGFSILNIPSRQEYWSALVIAKCLVETSVFILTACFFWYEFFITFMYQRMKAKSVLLTTCKCNITAHSRSLWRQMTGIKIQEPH